MPTSSSKSSSRLVGIDLAYALSAFACVGVGFFFVIGERIHLLNHLQYFPLLDIFPAWFLFLIGLTTALNMRNRHISTRKLTSFNAKKGTIILLIGLAFCPIWPLNLFVVCGVIFLTASFISRFNTAILKASAIFIGLISIGLLSLTSIDPHLRYYWITLAGTGWKELAGFTLFNGYYSILPWFTFFMLGVIHGRSDVRVRDWLAPSNLGAILWLGLALVAQYIFSSFYIERGDAPQVGNFMLRSKVYLPAFMLIGAGASVLLTNACVYVLKGSTSKRLAEVVNTLSGMKFSILFFQMALGSLTLAIFKLTAFSNWIYLAAYILALMGLIYWLVFFWKRRINKLGPIEWMTKRMSGNSGK